MADPTCPEILPILPLRAGSKGLPDKNLRMLAGQPLYERTMDQALRISGRCVITTDIPEILGAKLPSAVRVVHRPARLATDDTPMTPVLLSLFDSLAQEGRLPDLAVLLQATSPLREDADIVQAVTRYRQGDLDLAMTVTRTDPQILKYGMLDENRFHPVSLPQYCFANRQDLPDVVRPNGAVYVFSPQWFVSNSGFVTERIGAVEMPADRSLDIDGSHDLDAAEAAIQQSKREAFSCREALSCA